ncbi:hypothetical protein [Chitinophaga sp. CF118]|uniref:hypothetical protein n=1 Tax=Chitinophaga sp. CF118 TaxID=1884367 RepID=UPI0011602C63|nr:hypothetical protein [Chitinophaga sp. CF118]
MLLALAVSAFVCFGAHAQTIKCYVQRSPFEVTPNVTIESSTLYVLSQQRNPATGDNKTLVYPVLSTTGYTGLITPVYYWVAPSTTYQLGIFTTGSLTVKNTATTTRSLYVRVGVWISNAGGLYLRWATSESKTLPPNQSGYFTTPMSGAQYTSLNWTTSPGADAPTAVLIEVMEN